MKQILTLLLIISLGFTELCSVVNELMDHQLCLTEVMDTLPETENDKGDETLKKGFEDNGKVLSIYKFYAYNHFITIYNQFKAYGLNYQSPNKKIPVPPPKFG